MRWANAQSSCMSVRRYVRGPPFSATASCQGGAGSRERAGAVDLTLCKTSFTMGLATVALTGPVYDAVGQADGHRNVRATPRIIGTTVLGQD
jgi:hypothetical protein